ncbi:MAG: mechanosensitive ion channel family protein [Opitutales bacterium]|nr:mechanosensitive ion channel family protein [Opitutales bacterium]
MQWYLEKLTEFCNGMNLPPQYTQIAVSLILACGFILVLFCLQRLLRFVLVAGTHLWAKRSRNTWDDAFCEAKFPGRIAHLLIAILSLHGYAIVFAQNPGFAEIFKAGTSIYFAVSVAGTAYALVDAMMIIGTNNERLKDVPIKGFFQAIKIVLTLGVAIWVLSILSDKSPAYFLSGLGALMAILLIVFKDTLLGFTAGILISANDLVRNKDWIEIPGTNVDGEVFDVSLTTVKVRNWDNTIANVPAYTLISGAFKNWRGMEKSGGRRIKRAISIDMQTIHFASEQEIARWQKIELLKPYLTQKLEEIREANAHVPETADPSVPANTRNLTNIGTFRAYCAAYLKANRKIHQGMTMLVRQLDPKATGLPLEIYVFTNDTRWAVYENIQSDIFDHLFAIMPEFGLAPFQEPSGRNFS